MARPDSEYERDPLVAFRAPEAVMVSMSTAAERQGLSKSELIRRALERYLDDHERTNDSNAS